MHGSGDGNESRNLLERQWESFLAARASDVRTDAAAFADELPTEELRAMFYRRVTGDSDPAPLARPTPREVLADRYELLEPIGSGAIGQVWRARDRRLDSLVAVKVLTSTARDAVDVERLAVREGKLLARLSHPGIVRVHDTGRHGELFFIVMDLVGGLGLDELINHMLEQPSPRTADMLCDVVGPPAPGRQAVVRSGETWHEAVTRLVVALLHTLEAAHGVGVLHRDIKPGNVRVVGGGRPMLLDFGHGMLDGIAAGTLTEAMLGTPAYAAPEQWHGAAGITPSTDTYQVGVLLYELLTLSRCFANESTAQLLQRVQSGDFRRPREVDASIAPATEACVLRAMELDPARRYQTAEQFRADLEQLLAGRRPRAAAASVRIASGVRRFVRRNARSLLLVSAALAGGLGAWLASADDAPALRFVDADTVTVESGRETVMLAFEFAKDENGERWCAPLELSRGGGDQGLVCRLQPGAHDVQLAKVADPSLYGRAVVQVMFADAADDEARGRFEAAAHAMSQAREAVHQREGEWVAVAEFLAYLREGRGGAGVELPNVDLLAVGEWRSGGLSGVAMLPPR